MAGDPSAENFLRVVNTMVDALGVDLETALERANVPESLRAQVRNLRDEQTVQVIRRVRGVTNGGPREWWDRDGWDPAQGFYWSRQRGYLLDTVGRSPEAVDATDDDSNRVLQHLEDPRPGGPEEFDVRGLVVGHVQSGKTENFSALIAKGFDLGYRLVIVLSGIHNGLRQQTQRRLERELGISVDGVGRPPAGQRIVSLTRDTLDGDFDPSQDPAILQGNELVIAICKKWHTVLSDLNDFIDRADIPPNMPVLVVDDEADQASINTGGNRGDAPEGLLDPQSPDEIVDVGEDVDADQVEQEIDPSTTNRLIRELVTKFTRRSYVGYTATPFANVLIPADATDVEVLDDLFPRDFILTLFPRPGYVGTERLFGRDALNADPEDAQPGLDVINFVPDEELPEVSPKHAETPAADFLPGVPPSMEQAIEDWILATAGMVARLGWEHPSTMLIHIHQQTHVQNALVPQVQDAVDNLRRAWRYERDGAIPRRLEARWEGHFRITTQRIKPDADRSFADISENIDRLLRDPVPVLGLNSQTKDQLDFTATPELKAILVGGNRLSRGMTLEGLTVSYYVRETPYMDTLLQMGRWFGYRENYVDLTRLWTTRMLAGWFRDIALREEELRQVILEAERERILPIEAGLRIRQHPAMMVTSMNKMGAARPIRISYSGTLIQTSRFRLWDGDWLRENLAATQELFGGLGAHHDDDPTHLPVWRAVPAEAIIAFLRRYRTVQTRRTFDSDAAADYIEAQLGNGELRHWTVAVRTQANPPKELEPFPLGATSLPEINAISRTRLSNDQTSIGVLTQPADPLALHRGDEEIGLSEDAARTARRDLAADRYESLRQALLAQRGTDDGLLIVYPISRLSRRQPGADGRVDLFNDSAEMVDIPGVAIAFPRSSSEATIEYVGQSAPDEDTEA